MKIPIEISLIRSFSLSIFRRLIPALVLLLIVPFVAFGQKKDREPKQKQWKKVTICHEGNTIEISESALQAHLNHGDAAGPCEDPQDFEGTITPYYKPTGKINEPIGSELTALNESFEENGSAASDDIFVISENRLVLIEIVSQRGKKPDVITLLSTTYGISEFLDNGLSDIIVTVLFPIERLPDLNQHDDIIRFVRPVYQAITNSGVVTSLGDIAQQSDNARNAFSVDGEGIKIGVLSDSYNLKGFADADVRNGDLPGIGNPDGNTLEVDVLKDYPANDLGSRFSYTDEGRAMLQIIHDVAPKAELAFRSGVVSSRDMAAGIFELQAAECDIIVDDITFFKEPFYADGVVAQAVDMVTSQGIQYFTSAGNFGKNSYEAQFNPGNEDPSTHDFIFNNNEVDPLQKITMGVGFFRIVLQWDDDYYTLPGAQNNGAQNDLDIYIISDAGDILVNNNSNNFGGDPIEIMTFYVDGDFAASNIAIHRASGTDNVNFKYIVFEGKDFAFKEYAAGSSTITGHANSVGAMTVGAVLYSNTPAFDSVATIASFSSRGGFAINGVGRRKPDFVAPNGVNTTVDLQGFDIDSDVFPNFFGTSASAPHAAGAAALLLQAKTKFGVSFDVRQLLQQTAIDMEAPGFDDASGSGFIQADAAMLTFAAPIPTINELIVPVGATPGTAPFELTIMGKNLHQNSRVLLDGTMLPEENTAIISSPQLVVTIPEFTGDPAIQVITAPIAPTGVDGGISEPLYLFREPKKIVKVTADDKTKKYGERLPQFTASITVDGVPLASTATDLTLLDLGLENLTFQSPATSLGSVGFYVISPVDATSELDDTFHDLYDYEFINGTLVIEKILLKITPNDLTKVYGEKITEITFNYEYDMTNIDSDDNIAILNNLIQSHTSTFVGIDLIAVLDTEIGIVDRGRGIVNGIGWLITPNTLINRGRGIVNGNVFIDIPDVLLEDYELDPANTLTNRGRGIVNGGSFAEGEATMNRGRGIVNDDGVLVDRGRGIVNDGVLVNSDGGFKGFEDLIVIVDITDYAISTLFSINLISGLEVTTEESLHYIVPGGYFALESDNFDISYRLGKLRILPATLNVAVDDKLIIDGDPLPVFTSTITGYVYEENDATVFSSITYTPTSYEGAGFYQIVPTLEFAGEINYVLAPIVPGTLTVIELGINGRIAFAHVNESSNLEIELVDSDGSAPVSLPVGSESIRDPQFSTDGTQIVFTLSPTADNAPVFNPANGHYYELVQSGIITWANANTAANAASPTTPMPTNFTGHLVTITDQAENDFVGNLSDEGFRPWIGLTDVAVEGAFQWVTGEPFLYSNWDAGEPNNAFGGEDYVEFFGHNYKWNDIAASNPLTSSYVIEYESTTSPVPPSLPNLQTPQDQSLWKVNVDGSGLTELTSGISNHSSSFSPNGTKIAFIKDNEIAIMNSDGSGTSILTTSNTSKRWTAFSPDGQDIVYVQSEEEIYTDSFNSIWKVNINTGSTEQITPVNSTLYYRSPVFLKDGSKIIYVRHDRIGQTPAAIMSMNPDGSGEITLLTNEFITNDVDVSPDNTRLVFSLQDSEGSDYTLNTMDKDGANVEEIYREANLILWPSWGTNADIPDLSFVNIPDPNFEQALIDLGIDSDGIINQQILRSDAEAVTDPLFVTNKNISDLTGIEAFVNLTGLFCYENQLTEIDISQNTALTTFSIHTNLLTSLDVSQNTALTSLVCSDNQLTSLDVSNNLDLVVLTMNHNNISSLDLSKNTALERLFSHSNPLGTLDLSNNTLLETLFCLQNGLTTLDLSNNKELVQLSAGLNSLTELDVSQNALLTGLFASNNQITSIDISNNPLITRLNVSSNQLTSLDVRNGNNENITLFRADNNDLVCISVDDELADHSTWVIDAGVTMSDDCASGSTLAQGNITVFQNPVIYYLELVHADESVPVGDISIRIYDNNGNEQFSFIYGPATVELDGIPYNGLEIDMTQLQAGFYILHINDQQVVEIIRIQKE